MIFSGVGVKVWCILVICLGWMYSLLVIFRVWVWVVLLWLIVGLFSCIVILLIGVLIFVRCEVSISFDRVGNKILCRCV